MGRRGGFFVIVRGPLGAGKTTLSERLARVLGGQHLAIDRILEEQDLEQWEDGYISEKSFLRANAFAVREAEPALRRGTPVVIEGNFYWRTAVDDLVTRLRFPHVVFTLKVPLSVCFARDAGRKVSLGPDGVREVYEKTTTFDYGVGIDATGAVEDVLATMMRELGKGRGPAPERSADSRPRDR